MRITRKLLVRVAAAAVALFIIASPMGDSKHGLGEHHKFFAVVGQTTFLTSLAVFALFLVLAVVALFQRFIPARNAS